MTSEKQPEDLLKKLTEPFQFNDADLIIRARGVNFPVHKLILSHASPIFRDMFSLPDSRTTRQEEIPIVEVTEDAQTIHDMLSWIYPNANNVSLHDISTIHRLVLAMRKYSLPNLQLIVGNALKARAEEDPIRVFAIACNAEAPQIAQIAAFHALKIEFVDIGTCDIPEFNHLRAGTMRKLLQYHRTCGSIASHRILSYITQYPVSYHPFTPPSSHTKKPRPAVTADCTRWWTDYVNQITERSISRPIQLDYTSTKLVQEYCRGIESCDLCSQIAPLKLIEFGERIKKEVREGVDMVKLDLNEDDFLL